MKLIKLTDDHYIVVDETITHSTKPLEVIAWKDKTDLHMYEYHFDKIQKLSLQEVKELIGEVDVAEISYLKKLESSNQDKNWIGYGKGVDGVSKEKWKQIYNQAIEDNKEKKYTEAQLIWAIQEAYGHGQDDEFDGVNKIEESIKAITKHLQPKTSWEVEIVDGKLKLK